VDHYISNQAHNTTNYRYNTTTQYLIILFPDLNEWMIYMFGGLGDNRRFTANTLVLGSLL